MPLTVIVGICIGLAVLMGYYLSFTWLATISLLTGAFVAYEWYSEITYQGSTNGTSGKLGSSIIGIVITLLYVILLLIMWSTHYQATDQVWLGDMISSFFGSALR
jgi:hypothetical protein